MAENLACGYDISIKERAAEMVDAGMGWDSISSRLAIPRSTVKQWIMTYRAAGAALARRREPSAIAPLTHAAAPAAHAAGTSQDQSPVWGRPPGVVPGAVPS